MDIAGVTTNHYGSGSVPDDVEEMRNQVLKVIETLVETVKKTSIKVYTHSLSPFPFFPSSLFHTHSLISFFVGERNQEESLLPIGLRVQFDPG